MSGRIEVRANRPHEAVPAYHYVHDDGRTAGIGGAHPDYRDPGWKVVADGWTIRRPDGTTGGRFGTREEAEVRAAELNARAEEIRARRQRDLDERLGIA